MGVPGFFSWLMRQKTKEQLIMENLQFQKQDKNSDMDSESILYIDANCLFHPICFKVLNKTKEHYDKLEEDMIEEIKLYIIELIEISKSKEVFIAVDGVAPLAKINQQRSRRFKSVHDTMIRNEIKRKFGKETNDIWSNVVITPGTDFMEKLHQELLKLCENLSKKYKMTYSSYHTSGEGEHKILQDIKKKKQNKNIIIYGLDADLFFLALASNVDNIYLMRERSQINDNDDDNLSFISIDLVRKICNDCIKKEINNGNVGEDFTDDFIFICYLIGNDFLPHLPSMDIKKRSMELLIKEYVKTYMIVKKKLINKTKINMNFLKIFLKKLSYKEDYFFVNILNNNNEKICNKTDEYEKEIWTLENMCFLREDKIRLGKDKPDLWKYRYYENYFHDSQQEELVDEICENYLRGLMWVTHYYFKECPDWKWRYYHFQAPFISDISSYLNKTNMDLNKIIFKKDKPLKPLVQLLSVIPPKYNDILPEEYRGLMTSIESPIIDLFPEKIELDMINKDLYWKCIPLIPLLDINRIQEAIEEIKINEDDLIKNKEEGEYIFIEKNNSRE